MTLTWTIHKQLLLLHVGKLQVHYTGIRTPRVYSSAHYDLRQVSLIALTTCSLTSHTPSLQPHRRHYYIRAEAGTNLSAQDGWTAWFARTPASEHLEQEFFVMVHRNRAKIPRLEPGPSDSEFGASLITGTSRFTMGS